MGKTMTKQFPDWARAMQPVDMDGAAKLLGVSRRYLVDRLKEHPYYESRGRKKLFYPEHILLLREKLSARPVQKNDRPDNYTKIASSTERAYERALALASARTLKKPAPSK